MGNNLNMTRGDYKRFTLTVTDGSSPYDLTSCTVFFTMKKNYTDLDAAAVITKTVTEHTNAVGGVTNIILLPADTDDLELRNYFYDCQLKTADNKIYTVIKGLITVQYDVTIRTT